MSTEQFVSVRWKNGMRDVERMLELGIRSYERAASSGINRAASKARTQVRRRVAKEAGIKPMKLIARRIQLRKARPSKLVARLGLLSHSVPVSKLSGVRDTRKNVTARHHGKGVRAGRRHWRKGFLAKGIGGHTMAFERKGRSRTPLKVLKIDISAQADAAIEAEANRAADVAAELIIKDIEWRMGGNRGAR